MSGANRMAMINDSLRAKMEKYRVEFPDVHLWYPGHDYPGQDYPRHDRSWRDEPEAAALYKDDLRNKIRSIPRDDESSLFFRTRPYLARNSSFLEAHASVSIPERAQSSRVSSIGNLDRLAVETLHMVLLLLDVSSICRFMSVSSRAKSAVDSLRQYRRLVHHAGSVLAMLGKARLTKIHTVDSLHQVLSSPNCVSCDKPGAFVSLPTCERACLNCLNRNMRFWFLTADEARKAYVLRLMDVESLPTLRTVVQSTPGNRVRHQKVVNERHAAQLALQRHGETDDAGESRRSWVSVARKDEFVDWTTDGGKLHTKDSKPRKCNRWGQQFMEMPYVERETPESMLWCEGCTASYALDGQASGLGYSHGDSYVAYDLPRGYPLTVESAKKILAKEENCLREWLKAELLEHLKVCEGVSWLANWAEQQRKGSDQRA